MEVHITLYMHGGYRIYIEGGNAAEVLERARIIWDTFAPADVWKSARP